ncbi:hypothetical protein O7626_39520 [Micromonospora sp. WMMD1102]|uniref:hypothetical protein n=1 Tax=Micromonospora sp. WMMD1102 TaxID=3016105 RepID=UPI002415735E|nr:hypothetical protein [Micromonospora sp. WMMD1102]MDG4784329.1 hypothetical protein [Micromonospora sp. WMMD1102]MDG4784402.1 hypothetical protein [Micromonospora sp. WMMD1102]MDG4791906.1 hypothetical protein [Micromonospora sp. WMMD1102]
MTEGPTLLPTGRRTIWRQYLAGGRINAAPWEHTRSAGGVVGSCPCGGYLRPGPPYWIDKRQWFPSTCTTCGADSADPGPAPTRKRRGSK